MKGLFFIMFACLLWATDTLIRYPLLQKGLSASKIVFYEHLILICFFLPLLVYQRKFHSLLKEMVNRPGIFFHFFMIGGLGSALATLSFTQALTLLNPSLVILLQKFQPIVAIILAKIVLKETTHPKFLFCASLCLIGGFLISFEDIKMASHFILDNFNSPLKMSEEEVDRILMGHVYTFIAVFGWGSAVVFGRKLSLSGLSEKEIMGGRYFLGLITIIPFFIYYEPSKILPYDSFGQMILMVIISGMAAMFFYYKGLKIVPAKVGALAELFFPLSAVVVNWLALGIALNPMQLLGGMLLWAGSTIIEWKRY